jgi:hypothetical protein
LDEYEVVLNRYLLARQKQLYRRHPRKNGWQSRDILHQTLILCRKKLVAGDLAI